MFSNQIAETQKKKATSDALTTLEVQDYNHAHENLRQYKERVLEREKEVEELDQKIGAYESALQMLKSDKVVLEGVLVIAMAMKESK